MTTTQIPRGANLSLFFKDQTSFKTAATGNYSTTIAYSYSLGETKPLEDDPILGTTKNNTRDMTEPGPGLGSMAGQIVVPVDFSHLGYWLKSAHGAPSTSGTNPDYTHVFASGGVVLPAKTIERQLLKNGGTVINQQIGVMVNGYTLSVSRAAGFQRMTLDCVGYSEATLGPTGAGTPVAAVARAPFAAALGIYKIDTVQAALLDLTLNFSNGLVGREELGDARMSGYDIGDCSLTGSFRLRFRDTTLYDAAIAETPHAGELLFQASAARSLKYAMPNVRIERVGIPIDGPGFIDQTFNFRCHQDASNPMTTVTLKGAVASY